MVDIIHKNKVVLKDVPIAKDVLSKARGLMFASYETVRKGLCFEFSRDVKTLAATTMWFCFFRYEILYVNSSYMVVDKVVLNPWKMNYVPKDKCKYVFESIEGTFKDISIGDTIELRF